MKLVTESSHSRGEFGGISLNMSIWISLRKRPAIIQVNVLISQVSQSQTYHQLGLLLYYSFIVLALESSESVITHGWNQA